MADVEVYDAAYVAALEASVVVSGFINENGHLVLERGNGEQFNAGVVSANSPWADVVPDFFGSLTVGNGTLKCRVETVNKTRTFALSLVCGTTTTGPVDVPLEFGSPGDGGMKDFLVSFHGSYQDFSTSKDHLMIWKGAQREVRKYNPATDTFEYFFASSLGASDILAFTATYELI